MTDTQTAGEQVQEEILKTVRNSQSAVVAAIQAWARTIQSITPALPDANMPFAEKLPKPQELIASAYDFAEQLLASQRKFAEDVLKTTAPMLNGHDDAPARKNGSTANKPPPRAPHPTWFPPRSWCLRIKKTFSICRHNDPAQSPPVGTAVPLPNGRPGVSARLRWRTSPCARRKASCGLSRVSSRTAFSLAVYAIHSRLGP
jgi:hypothetical protein